MMRQELELLLALAKILPADELPFLVGDLEAIKTVAHGRKFSFSTKGIEQHIGQKSKGN